MRALLFVLLGLSFFPGEDTMLVFSQDVRTELSLLNDAMNSPEKLSYEMTYLLYGSRSTSDVLETKTGLANRHGETAITKIENLTTLYTPDLTLVIDNANKVILIGNTQYKPFVGFSTDILDSLLGIYEDVKFYQDVSGQMKIEFSFGKKHITEYSYAALTYDPTTHFIKSITLYFKQTQLISEEIGHAKPVLKINFSNYRESLNLDPSEFQVNKYLIKDNDQYNGTGPYASYQILDQRLPIH